MMNPKLLCFCLFLAVLLIPAELKRKKDNKDHHEHHDPEHHNRESQDHREQHNHHDRRDHHEHRDHEHHHQEHVGSEIHRQATREKRRERYKDIIQDIFFKIIERTGDDEEDDELSDWLYDLQEPWGQCNPNPCLNNGVCKQKGKGKIKCDCVQPYHGKRCEKGEKICKIGLCGRGECVLISSSPFYQCKCKEPFQPPDCKTFSVCDPNPCRNGGKCIKNGNDFDCQCPQGYKGRFCHVGPNDCYVGNGESYRGNASETDDGDECLHWNSHFVLVKGTNPFNTYEDKDGLGLHNFCRNPDGDKKPWCFFRRGRRLQWDYCDVTKCPEPTSVVPTAIAPPVPDPTAAKPQPPKPEPTADTKLTTAKTPVTEKPTLTPEPVPEPTDSTLIQQFMACGNPQPKKAITRIFGGLKVTLGTLPWQVSLQMRPQNTQLPFKHICGGVLIASCWVLTAGHCILQGKDMQVVMGGLTLDTTEPTEQNIRVADVIVHENFKETSTAVYNDIALLRLQGTGGVCANESQFVKAACLPDAPLPDGMDCTISGWGITEKSQYGSSHLLQANVLLINQQKCSEPAIYGNVLDGTMFCAGHLQGGVDSCQGDSGGPLTCKQNSTHVVYGLVSWGDECGRKNKPGVYTRVTHFLDWIKSKTQAASP